MQESQSNQTAKSFPNIHRKENPRIALSKSIFSFDFGLGSDELSLSLYRRNEQKNERITHKYIYSWIRIIHKHRLPKIKWNCEWKQRNQRKKHQIHKFKIKCFGRVCNQKTRRVSLKNIESCTHAHAVDSTLLARQRMNIKLCTPCACMRVYGYES